MTWEKFLTIVNGLDFIVLVEEREAIARTDFTLNGNNMHDKEKVLKEFRNNLDLPEGMGYNYDSLFERLLPDLWPGMDRFSLTIEHAQSFIEHCELNVIKTLFDMLTDAAQEWRQAHGDKDAFSIILNQ